MNLQWFRVPEKIYCKKACLPVALEELKYILNKQKVLIATSLEMQKQGMLKPITDKLNELNIAYAVHDVSTGMTNAVKIFEPDCILAFGADIQIFLAQKLWIDYEYPDLNPEIIMDKPELLANMLLQSSLQMGKKAYFIAVPCFIGMGSQVKPFALNLSNNNNNNNNIFFADMSI
ncbi:MAG: iron-containing alcohol dehydrogenase, partial [Oscillospiraceae bacterium]|nr:iron-containing alcohol dehydrogenase [Oscillospiraceae bacterium]